jgi:hypothetical protein
MYTHLAFVPGVLVALQREPVMVELVVLQGIVCVLSLWYHRNNECECGMAKVEHAFAHALFVYGWIQMLRSPGMWTFCANMACACVTLPIGCAPRKYPAPEDITQILTARGGGQVQVSGGGCICGS